jgi:hypothetical protein
MEFLGVSRSQEVAGQVLLAGELIFLCAFAICSQHASHAICCIHSLLLLLIMKAHQRQEEGGFTNTKNYNYLYYRYSPHMPHHQKIMIGPKGMLFLFLLCPAANTKQNVFLLSVSSNTQSKK